MSRWPSRTVSKWRRDDRWSRPRATGRPRRIPAAMPNRAVLEKRPRRSVPRVQFVPRIGAESAEEKIMISKLSVTSVKVLDQDEALDFYVNKLGLEVARDLKQGPFRW